MRRILAILALSMGIVLLPERGWAQGQGPPPPEQKGRIDLATPPVAPPVGRSYHMHDGFYARASVGFGSLGARFDDGHISGQDLSGSGLSLGLDLMIGGSPSPGLALGGALLAEGAFSAEFSRGPRFSEDRSLSVILLGPFVDGFPMPSRGWHVGGMLGFAAAGIEGSDNDRVTETRGFGGAFWLGHDFWVADEWSMGPLARLTGTLTRDSDTDATASSLSLLFLFTALHH